MALLSASGLSLFFGDMEIFSGLDLEVAERTRIGIVGPNGCGKTSLLRIIVGEQEPHSGAVHRARGLRVGYVPQVPTLDSGGTLGDEVMTAFDDLRRIEHEMQTAASAIPHADAASRGRAEAYYGDLAHEFEHRGGYTYHNLMERTVAGLGLTEEALRTPAAGASGGERTRAALAKALLADPDLLVLDEPTNHLDLEGLTWLERFLGRFNHAFIVVSHDREFLDRVVTQIWDMENGELRAFPGNYSRYRVLKAEADLARQREYEKQRKYIAKEEEFIRRYGAGQRAQEAQGRETRLARLERIAAPTRSAEAALAPVSATRTAQVAIRTRGLVVGFRDGEERGPLADARDGEEGGAPPVLLLKVPDMDVNRGARIGIIGSNGAGKTTLIKTILGMVPPLEGTVVLGGNVRPGYYRQGLEDLPEDSTVLDALLEVKGMSPAEGRAYLARFLFRGDEAFQLVGTLSGGQRSRLALARLIVAQPNVLVLDEPTNHLDIPSREALEEVLRDFAGTLIFVSHDRHLVALLAQQLWIVGNGSLTVFPGGFESWMREKEEAASPPPRPKAPGRPRPVKERPAKPSKDDPARMIADLEEKLAEIERQLQGASEQRDLAAITRLGVEHTETRALLDRKWVEWMG